MIVNGSQPPKVASDAELVGRVWNLSWPTVVWSALEACLGLTDLVMVRFLGTEATAAVGVSRQVTFLVDSAAVAVAAGIIAVISQAVGAKHWDTVGKALRQSSVLMVLIAVPVALLGFVITPTMLALMKVDSGTMQYAVPYLRVCFLGTAFAWLGTLATAFLRSIEDVLTPLKVATAVVCLNLPLNYLLIHGSGPIPALGVAGAAWGTVLAKTFGAAVYLWLLSRRKERGAETKFSLDLGLVGRILGIGVPMALAGLVRNGARLVFLAIVGGGALGTLLHAAVGVGMQVRLFTVLPALAFQVATAILVGQAVGRGDFEEARRLGRRSAELLAGIMLVIVAGIIVCAGPLANLLIDDVNAAKLAATVLRWFAVAQFFTALNICLQGALLGAGDTLPNLRYTFVTQWVVMLPVAQLSSFFAGWQVHGPLVAWTLAPVVLLILVARRFYGERWKNQYLNTADA